MHGWVSVACEGQTDLEVIRSLLRAAGLPAPGNSFVVSKPAIIQRLAGYNEAAENAPWYVQIDLDHDFECAPDAAAEWLDGPADLMRLSVVRPELEAWLLADRLRAASWLGVSVGNLPRDPEDEADAKDTLLRITRAHGSLQRQRQLLPRDRSGRHVGPEYEAELVRYARQHWRPDVARNRAASLDRAMNRLDDLHRSWLDSTGAQ